MPAYILLLMDFDLSACVTNRYAVLRRAVLAAALAAVAAGCAGSGPAVNSIRLAPLRAHAGGTKGLAAFDPQRPMTGAGWRFELLGSEPFVYRRIDPPAELPLYFTTIEQCGQVTAESRVNALRQLLVGLEEVQIRRQQEFTLAGRSALLSVVRVSLESLRLPVAVLSVMQGECLRDFVIWLDGAAESSAAAAALEQLEGELAGFRRFLDELFMEIEE